MPGIQDGHFAHTHRLTADVMEQLVPFATVRELLLRQCPVIRDADSVPASHAAGRYLAAGVTADAPFPARALAAGDGIAVRAEDSVGASPYNPLPLSPGAGTAVEPGDPLPPGADAVAPWDAVEGEGAVRTLVAEVDAGKGVCRRGQLLPEGDRLLDAGRRLGSADAALLAALGHQFVAVRRAPRVAVVFACAEGAADIASRLLAPRLTSEGAELHQRAAPDADTLARALPVAAAESDLVLVVGAAGEGPGAFAPSTLAAAGRLHGHPVALRPGRAAGVGEVAETPVLLVPAEPVAACAVCDLLAGAAIRALSGAAETGLPHCPMTAPLARKITSPLGELGYVRASLEDGRIHPRPAGTDLDLTALSRTEGFVVVAPESEGHPPTAEVTLYRDRC